eukprot:TRINITY_DN2777_c0_g1_i4.p1 TRINITY_DN2777_c0_g1~~TRINITY_DN2777_c0_g1_i4.p1  ORF type:complete len:445 (+),score=79.80 TRINITY_DN2777_c0_g1_i4:87-1421(+)
MIRMLFVLLLSFSFFSSSTSKTEVGYWENWVDVDWWQNYVPGNCLMGCAKPQVFLEKTTPYSQINYGFTFITENPNPNQVTCNKSPVDCPIWDGLGIYAAQASKSGATVVSESTTIGSIDNSPGLIAISEVCRLARQAPNGPKRCLICLGGWSDWSRLGNPTLARKLAQLVAKMVALSFADGVDLDFEHMTEFNSLDGNFNEFDNFNVLVKSIREEFAKITDDVWKSNAQTRGAYLSSVYNSMPSWEKSQSQYYPTNIQYMQELQDNGRPYLEISWTTRFNAFLNHSNPFNYLDPDSPVPPPFATDNEGQQIWPFVGSMIDSVNIMAYDGGSPAGPLKFNFTQILKNFVAYGPSAQKLNIGLEPGDQNGGGVWEGLAKDQEVSQYIAENDYGGVMIWAINPSSTNSARWAPILAKSVNSIVKPTWPYLPVPTYSKCNPQTGWNN